MKEFIKWKATQFNIYADRVRRNRRIKKLFGKEKVALFEQNSYNDSLPVDKFDLQIGDIVFSIRRGTTDVQLVDSIIVGKYFDKVWRGEYYQATEYLNMRGVKEPCILDGGANAGIFSVLCKYLYPESHIIAVEPEQDNYDVLCSNVEKLGVICLKNGLWSHKCHLEVIDRRTGDWGFVVKECEGLGTIDALAIDDVIEQFSISHFDLVKLDVEGSEYEIFKARSKSWIDITDAIVIETHDHIIPGCDSLVNEFLAENGFVKTVYEENQFFVRGGGHI